MVVLVEQEQQVQLMEHRQQELVVAAVRHKVVLIQVLLQHLVELVVGEMEDRVLVQMLI